MYKIMASGPKNTVAVESTLETEIAAKRRLKMLNKYHPENAYWIDTPKPAVTVTRISETDPTAIHIVRNAA